MNNALHSFSEPKVTSSNFCPTNSTQRHFIYSINYSEKQKTIPFKKREPSKYLTFLLIAKSFIIHFIHQLHIKKVHDKHLSGFLQV